MKILIVDDEQCIRDSFKELLEERGYEVVVARNGADGLDEIRTTDDFDILVTDLHMPALDGERLVQVIRRALLHRNKPIIAITAYPDRYDLLNMSLYDICEYLIKPVTEERLIEAIEHCYEKYTNR